MKAFEFISDKKNEANAKLLLMYCLHMVTQPEFKNNKSFDMSINEFIAEIGISKGQVIRAQRVLKKYGALKITPSYCTQTGKRGSDLIEIVY